MFESANAALVGGWGLILGIAGLIISIAGFAITIIQIRRTNKATEAVRLAVLLVKNRMSVFDHASECLRASKSLEHAIQLLRGKNWEDASARLLEAQSALFKVSMSLEGSIETKNLSRRTSDQLLNVVRELEEAFDKKLDYDATEITLTLRKQINSLDYETIAAQRELYDGQS